MSVVTSVLREIVTYGEIPSVYLVPFLIRYTFWAGLFDYTCSDEVTFEIMDEDGVCGSGYSCPDGYTCDAAGDFELNHGVTSYEDIWHALLQVQHI